MSRHSSRAARVGAGVVILAFASAGLAPFFQAAHAWPLGGADVTLDNFTAKTPNGGALVVAHAEFVNASLSKDEIEKLLTPDTPAADERDLIAKLKADKISIPSIAIDSPEAKVRLTDLVATGIDGGKIASFTIGGFEASGTDKDGAFSAKSGALKLDGLDASAALKVDTDPQDALQKARLGALTWSGLDLVVPDTSETPAKTMHLSIGSLEIHSDYAGDVFKQGSTKASGLVFEPAPDSSAGKSLASLGYAKVALSVSIGATYKVEAKTLSLDDFTLDGVDTGTIALKANFSDIAPALFGADEAGRMQALYDGGVVSLELKLVNAGLFEKALAYAAKQQGSDPETLKKQAAAAVGQMAPLLLGGDAAALKAAGELQKFIQSPKNLTVALKAKSGALKAADFMAMSDPTAFASKVEIAAAANQ
jgi:hypothetical protein